MSGRKCPAEDDLTDDIATDWNGDSNGKSTSNDNHNVTKRQCRQATQQVRTSDGKGDLNIHIPYASVGEIEQSSRPDMVQAIISKIGNVAFLGIAGCYRDRRLPRDPLDWSNTYLEALYRIVMAINVDFLGEARADLEAALEAAALRIHPSRPGNADSPGGPESSDKPLGSDGLLLAWTELAVIKAARKCKDLDAGHAEPGSNGILRPDSTAGEVQDTTTHEETRDVEATVSRSSVSKSELLSPEENVDRMEDNLQALQQKKAEKREALVKLQRTRRMHDRQTEQSIKRLQRSINRRNKSINQLERKHAQAKLELAELQSEEMKRKWNSRRKQNIEASGERTEGVIDLEGELGESKDEIAVVMEGVERSDTDGQDTYERGWEGVACELMRGELSLRPRH